MSSELQERHRIPTKSTGRAEGTASQNVCSIIIKKTRAEIPVHLLTIYTLEIEKYAGASFSNDIITIER